MSSSTTNNTTGNEFFHFHNEFTATHIATNTLATSKLVVGDSFNLSGLTTVVGFVPSTFATAGASSYTTFVTSNGITGPATSENALFLPNNAILKDVVVTNGGVPITSSGTFTVAVNSVLNGSGSGTPLVTDVTVSALNSGGFWMPLVPNTSVSNYNTGNYITVENSAAVTSGSLAIYVHYFIAPY